MVSNHFTESIARLFDRDIAKLESEIKQYPSDESLWTIPEGISNSGGTLCLHLCGNLQHYIGYRLGNSAYQRQRNLEFSTRNVSKEALLSELAKTRHAVASAFKTLDTHMLSQEYPEKVFDFSMTTLYFLIHLEGHLNYHLGQINYHRRITLKK